jgi:hypothetical protein
MEKIDLNSEMKFWRENREKWHKNGKISPLFEVDMVVLILVKGVFPECGKKFLQNVR